MLTMRSPFAAAVLLLLAAQTLSPAERPCLPPGVSPDIVTRVPVRSVPRDIEGEDGAPRRVVIAWYGDGTVTSLVVWHRADVLFYDSNVDGPDLPVGSTRWLTEDWKLRASPRAECAWRPIPASASSKE